MPELPEVEITRRGICAALPEPLVTGVSVRERRLRYPVPDDLDALLVGRRLLTIGRRAKYLLLQNACGTLIVHLGMSGSLRVLPRTAPAERHDHVDIVFGEQLLRYTDPRRFGALLWTPAPPEKHPLLCGLGVEPLSDDFDGKLLHTLTRGRATPIKLFLMDARHVVGIGNIYASESLFRAAIRPATGAGKLSAARCDRLAHALRTTLEAALEAGGSTLRNFVHGNGEAGCFQQQYFVYGRGGLACKRCGSAIVKRIMGQRSTFHCPRCQAR